MKKTKDKRQKFTILAAPCPLRGLGGVEKVLFNHKEHKVGAKYTKVNTYISEFCDLYVNPLRPLWLMDFSFFNTPD